MGRLRSALRIGLSSPTGIAAFALLVIFGLFAIIGPPIWGDAGSRIDAAHAYEGPSSHALLGTDGLGRDVLARTLAATRLSLGLALAATAIAILLGVPFGAIVGIANARARRIASRAIGFAMALPGTLVALVVVTIVGPGALGATLAIGIALAPVFARTTQTLAASIAESEFLAAARVLGVGPRRLLFRYILRNTAEPLMLQVGVGASLALVLLAALSFLGLGVQAPSYDWGRVLNEGVDALYTTPLAAITPGVAVMFAGVTFSFLGETIARSLNPALRLEVSQTRRARRHSAAIVATRAPAPQTLPAGPAPVAAVENLRVRFSHDGGWHDPVAGVSFALSPGEIVGVVGESGSGKSLTALALAGLLPPAAHVSADRLEFKGTDLRQISRRARRRLLATSLAVVFQDPMSSLNPALRVGRQLTEKVQVHLGMRRGAALALAEQRLTQVHLPAARMRLGQYPHEYSGGMRQRAMIAMGLMTDPALIIADEPTTALDVTVQAQILNLLREINRRSGTTVLFISHDLAVVSELCSRVIVMYAGRIVEVLDAAQLAHAAHPYTQALLNTVIDFDTDPEQPLTTIAGQPPTVDRPAAGCPFAPRCPEAMARCHEHDPDLLPLGEPQHLAACWARSGEAAADAPVQARSA